MPGRPPEISVILVNWNRKDLLRQSLQSLRSQGNTDFEIIVVDNGSNDGSVTMIQAEFLTPDLPLCKLIANPDNRGFCAANNQGIAAAQGEFIALLNNDAVAAPDWLAELRAGFSDPNVGMCASKILVYGSENRIDKVGHLIYPDGQNRGRGTGEIDHGQYDQEEEVAWPDGCAAMYRASMLRHIGGFDEDLFAYADDAELGLRARIAGWTCLYRPKAVVYHRRGATLGQASVRRLVLIERNRILLAAKLFPVRLLWRNVFYTAARLAAGIGAAAAGEGETRLFPGWRGKWMLVSAFLRAWWQAIPMIPRMWAKRKEVRRFQKLSSTEICQLIDRFRIPLRTLSRQAS